MPLRALLDCAGLCAAATPVLALDKVMGPGYAALRSDFQTSIHDAPPAPQPPRGVYELVKYPAPIGPNAAYATPVRKARCAPAIAWNPGRLRLEFG